MSSERPRWLAIIVMFTACLLSGCAATIMTVPCDTPKVSNFNVPFVYLVVLPYAYRDQAHSLAEPTDLGTAATRTLNEVATLEAVRMGAEATDMHVTLLEDTGGGCKIDTVYAALGDPRRRSSHNVYSTIVFFWGEVFDEEQSLVVQSHLRVLWKDNDRIRIRADVGEGAERVHLEFVSEVPYQTLSFAPRHLATSSGAGDVPELRAKLVAWAVPSEDRVEDQRPLPRSFVFLQLKKSKRGDWAEVQDLNGGEAVWIPLRHASAASILPEFSFANALADFVSFQTAPDRDAASGVVRRLDEFRGGYGQSGKSAWNVKPDAAADVLQGALQLAGGDMGDRRSAAKARQLLDRAQAALPDDAVVLTLSAMARVGDCCTTRDEAQRLGAMFEAARQLDSANRLIATNLTNWYKLAKRLAPGVRPDSDEEIARKLGDLENALR